MASIALGIAGSAGAGTIGQIIGATLGAYVDSRYLMPAIFGQETAEPSYGGLNLAAADEGAPVWRVHGDAIRVPGLVLFVDEPRSVSRVDRIGKRGERTTHTWYTNIVLGFGKSVAGFDRYIERIYANNTLVFDERDPISIDVYLGQQGGVSSAPSTGVIYDYDTYNLFFGTTGYGLASIETLPQVDRTVGVTSTTTAGFFNTIEVQFDASHGYDPGESFMTRWDVASGSHDPALIWAKKRYWGMTAHNSDNTKAYIYSDVPPPASVTAWNVSIYNFRAGNGRPTDLTIFDPAGKDIDITTPSYGTRSWIIYSTRELANGRTQLLMYPSRPGEDRDIGSRHIRFLGTDGRTALSNPSALDFWHLTDNNGSTITLGQDRTPYNLSISEGGAADWDFGYAISRTAGGDGTSDQEPLPRLIEWVGDTQAPGYREMTAVAIEDWNLSSTGNAIGNIEAVVKCRDVTVAEALTNICKLHGVDTSRLDVSGITGDLRGYRYNGIVEGRQALQPLILAFDIRARETDDGIVMFTSDNSPTLTIPEDDWLPSEDGSLLSFRERNTQIKLRSVQVKFLDFDKDQAPGNVTETRQSETGGESRLISLDNLVLTEDEARAIARRILRQAKAHRYEVQGRLPMTYADLTENTVVTTTVGSQTWRFRTTRVDVGANFEVRVEGFQEEVYA